MEKNQKRVVVFGNDHTNSLGVVQCLGREGFSVSAVVWGAKSGLVASSKFADVVYDATTPQACVDIIRKHFDCEEVAIIATCDTAAIELERNRLSFGNNFRFEYAQGEWSIEELCEKDLQVRLAKEVGFNVPWSSRPIESVIDVLDEVPFPCITKSLVSCKGSKNDLTIVRTREDLLPVVENLLTHTPRILLQQYIERDYEISILGCGLKDGECIIPCVENKLTLYPKNVGLEAR